MSYWAWYCNGWCYCSNSVISCNMAAVDFTHTILANPGSVAATSVASSACYTRINGYDSSGYCSYSSSLEIWTESSTDLDYWSTYSTGASGTWPWIRTSNFSTSNTNRRVTVDTTDYMSYLEPVTYKLRWKAVNNHNSGYVVYDYFDITIRY